DPGHRLVVGEIAEAPRAVRDLRDLPAGHRDAEELFFSTNAGREVDELSVRREPGTARLEIPIRRQVDRVAACSRTNEQIAWPSVVQLLSNHHLGPEGARISQILAVG